MTANTAIDDSRLSKVRRSSIRSRAGAVGSAIQQISEQYQDLLTEIQILEDESNTYKDELLKQKAKCESKTCSGSEGLKNIIQLAASTAIRLNETKNLNIVSDLLKVLCGEVPVLTPPKDSQENKENEHKTTPFKSPKKKSKQDTKKMLSPKKECNSSLEDVSFNEESVSEIDVTPGRTSPIIVMKKLKSSSSLSTLLGGSVDSKEKKKCPSSWPTPEKKMVKLAMSPKGATTGKGRGRSRQSRLTTFLAKPTPVVDLTHSPGSSAGADSLQNNEFKVVLRQESSDNDDTILPSQTSTGPTNNVAISYKQHSKENSKLKKSPLSLKKEFPDGTEEPHSAKLQESSRCINSPFKIKTEESPHKKETKLELQSFGTPKKSIIICPNDKTPEILEGDGVGEISELKLKEEMLADITQCDDDSMSIMQRVEGLNGPKPMEIAAEDLSSKSKRPLEENRNLVNMLELDSSMSILDREPVKKIEYKSKRKYVQEPGPVFKEPTVRKKAEKMALPGWCCQECVNFFGDLYASDPNKIDAIVSRCSKHRGRNNPSRPATPPGFWHPRWDVPECTLEFNARNDAL